MRQINWDDKLSDEDIEWLRNSGHMSEEQITTHQNQFDAKVPDPETPDDIVTVSALDPQGASSTPAETGDGIMKIDPTQTDPQDGPEDDYDTWSKADLEIEVGNRNEMPDTSAVEVVGTGSNGNITKADLIKGLRLWDVENPDALADDED